MAIVLDGTTGITTPDLTDTSLTSGRVVYAGASGNLTGSTNLVFDSANNLGIGTSSPTASASNRTLTINAPATFGSLIDLKTNETLNLRIFSGVTNSVLSVKTATYLSFETNDTERIRIPADAGGIQFPAVQAASSNANTLDDYEEGTWTPSLGGTTTYYTQTGQYTKVGNLVFIKGILVINSIGTGSTTLISGLPFTNTAGIVGVSVGSFFQSATSIVSFFAQIASNGATIAAFSLTAAGTTEAINAIFQSNTQFQFSACYRV